MVNTRPLLLPVLLVSCCLWWGAAPVCAAQSRGPDLPSTLSASATVSLVTVMPGDQAWNLFGHGALRVSDPIYGFDATFNYGMFTFDDAFIGRFVYGELDYLLAVYPFALMVADAKDEERTVIEQSLDLDELQRQALYSALLTNALPENSTYRYDFLYDNCSTRLVDMMRAVLGSGLALPAGPDPELTFRELLASHLGPHPWFALGIETALGGELEQLATFEQGWFLPALFLKAVDRGVIDGRALVSKTETLYDSGRAPVTSRAQWPFSLVGALLAAVGLSWAKRRARAGRRLSPLIDGALLFLCGLTGVVLLGLWFGTLHHVTAQNGNVLWALPTHLFAAFLLGRSATTTWLRVYLALSGALILVAWLGGLASWLQPMPVLLQLLLPWLGCRLLWRGLGAARTMPANAG